MRSSCSRVFVYIHIYTRIYIARRYCALSNWPRIKRTVTYETLTARAWSLKTDRIAAIAAPAIRAASSSIWNSEIESIWIPIDLRCAYVRRERTRESWEAARYRVGDVTLCGCIWWSRAVNCRWKFFLNRFVISEFIRRAFTFVLYFHWYLAQLGFSKTKKKLVFSHGIIIYNKLWKILSDCTWFRYRYGLLHRSSTNCALPVYMRNSIKKFVWNNFASS